MRARHGVDVFLLVVVHEQRAAAVAGVPALARGRAHRRSHRARHQPGRARDAHRRHRRGARALQRHRRADARGRRHHVRLGRHRDPREKSSARAREGLARKRAILQFRVYPCTTPGGALPRVFETILSRPGFENSRGTREPVQKPFLDASQKRPDRIRRSSEDFSIARSMSGASVEGSDLPRGGKANAPRVASHFVGTPRHSATKPFERGPWRRCVARWRTVPPV